MLFQEVRKLRLVVQTLEGVIHLLILPMVVEVQARRPMKGQMPSDAQIDLYTSWCSKSEMSIGDCVNLSCAVECAGLKMDEAT